MPTTDSPAEIAYEWRGAIANTELAVLHAEGFGAGGPTSDWETTLERHSLGWVTARLAGRLVGFVNVAWDGGAHAVIFGTVAAEHLRRRGVGTHLVTMAADRARESGCHWLHVDFEESLNDFYLDACGFRPSPAGLMDLRVRPADNSVP